MASVPTDPIPQPSFDQYAQPSVGGDVWSQQTVAHGGQHPPPPKERGRGGVVVLVIVAILVLGGGGGFAAYTAADALVKQHVTPTATTTATTTTTTTATKLDLTKVIVGDCLINVGTVKDPVMQPTACTTANSFKVIRVARGKTIPQAPDGTLDRTTTSPQVCKGLQYDNFYAYWEDDDRTKDVFFCLSVNATGSGTPTAS